MTLLINLDLSKQITKLIVTEYSSIIAQCDKLTQKKKISGNRILAPVLRKEKKKGNRNDIIKANI